jgi:hypothetical protein
MVFGPPATLDSVRAVVDTMPEIVAWRYDMPNAFYLLSYEGAEQIATSYRARRKDAGMFLVTEINRLNMQGWLANETWHLLNTLTLPERKLT